MAPAAPPNRDVKQAHVTAQWKYDRPLLACRFDPLGRYAFVSAEDNSVLRWNLADEQDRVVLQAHESWVRAIEHSLDGRWTVTGGCDGRLVWWETAADSPRPHRVLDAHRGWIRSLAVSPDGKLLASGGNDHTIRLWNLEEGTLAGELEGHTRHVYCVYFSPHKPNSLYSGDLLGNLKEWDVAARTTVGEFDAKALHSYNSGQQVDFGGVRALAISTDGRFLAAGGLHNASNPLGSVHDPLNLIFEAESRKLVQTCVAADIRSVIWRQIFLDEKTVMAVSGGTSGGLLHFWTPDEPQPVFQFKLPNLARDLDLHADGLQVATTHFDGHLRLTRLAAPAG
jgi:WD40 repeat protein